MKVEQFDLLPPPDPPPAEWEQYKVPNGYERSGDVIPIRPMEKVIEADFDGEILKATRRSRDRFCLRFPDGERIEEAGFDKFMSKVAIKRAKAREYRAARARSERAEAIERELRERTAKVAQEAAQLREEERARAERMAASLEDKHAFKARSRNKLAAKCAPHLENFQPRFINPKPLIGKDPDWWFAPRFAWLKNVPGMTGAEQDAYAWMAFRASDDGVFRGSLRRLAKDVNPSLRHLQRNVIPSLLARKLIVREDRGVGRAAWFRFVDPEQLGWRTKFATPCELSASELANSLPISGEQSPPHKELVKEKRERTVVVEKRRALVELATTATDHLDLIEKLKPYFPGHNLAYQFARFVNYRKANKLVISGETFVNWMLEAHPPLVKAKRRVYVLKNAETPRPDQDVDPEALARFEQELAARKEENLQLAKKRSSTS